MAYQIQPNDILQVRIVGFENTDTQLGVNVLHYQVIAITGGVPTGLDCAISMDGLVKVAYKAFMGANANYIGVGVSRIFPLPRLVEDTTRASTGAGTGGANLLPLQVSGLVKFQSTQAARHGRGRCYPFFPSAAWADADGKMNAGGQAAVAAIRTAIPQAWAMANGGNSANLSQILWDRVNHVARGVAATFSSNLFATQRRRGQLGRTNVVPF